MNFPIFIDLNQKNILIVGGGSIAYRRAVILAPYCGNISLVAPSIKEEFSCLKITLKKREFEKSDIEGAFLVLAATNNPNLNLEIARLCRAKNILVNVCSSHENCDFYFPAIAENENMLCAVASKSGTEHRSVKEFAAKIRNFIKK